MLAQSRAFFAARGMTEVDVPALSPYASIDVHIDLIPAIACGCYPLHLHSSPEYGMKQLLADGIGDIYQLSHVFRDFEQGRRHQLEFTMIEWYRLGFTFEELIEETLHYMELFLGPTPRRHLTYHEAFATYAKVAPEADCAALVEAAGSECPPSIHSDREALLSYLIACIIEPSLNPAELTVISHFPASQAALAQTTLRDGHQVALRFEVFYRGLELCNGYSELADPIEQERRLHEANEQRIAVGKNPLPIDTHFLAALRRGLPPCCGVAVGFDRLMMARHRVDDIAAILPLTVSLDDWEAPTD